MQLKEEKKSSVIFFKISYYDYFKNQMKICSFPLLFLKTEGMYKCKKYISTLKYIVIIRRNRKNCSYVLSSVCHPHRFIFLTWYTVSIHNGQFSNKHKGKIFPISQFCLEGLCKNLSSITFWKIMIIFSTMYSYSLPYSEHFCNFHRLLV